MNASRKTRRQERHHKVRSRAVELNIVSMIDVFAVLVFFLLVSSSLAASRLNVISLNLPSPDQNIAPEKDPPLQLTITVRAGSLLVSDRKGALRELANTPDGYNIQALTDVLVEAKKAAPAEESVTVLLEPDIAYDNLVKVMDAARLAPAEARAAGLPRELFPSISIGDAPLPEGAAPAPAEAPAP
ncbi:MAG TPA: biopolymer transporter ExbD [Solimonas sp.]|nr:biopolymer transporter ExbD [Solimonas sp.]